MNNGQAIPNKEHLHNIAKLLEAYLAQNVPQIPAPNTANYYETVIVPLQLEILHLLKRNSPRGRLLDEIFLSLEPFMLNPANQACREENGHFLTESFNSIYDEYVMDTKGCGINSYQSIPYGNYKSNRPLESKPLGLKKIFERQSQDSDKQRQLKTDDLKLENVYDLLYNYRSNDEDSHEKALDKQRNDDNVSDVEIRGLTNKISSLLTNLQADRAKRSVQTFHKDMEFVKFCKSFVLKRFLDALTFIVQRYIDTADCKTTENLLSNFKFDEGIGNKGKIMYKDQSGATNDVSENINNLFPLQLSSNNEKSYEPSHNNPMVDFTSFQTDSDAIGENLQNVDKYLQQKNRFQVIGPEKIPGMIDDQTLLYSKGPGNEDSNDYDPNLTKLVDAVYEPKGETPYRYPKLTDNSLIEKKTYSIFKLPVTYSEHFKEPFQPNKKATNGLLNGKHFISKILSVYNNNHSNLSRSQQKNHNQLNGEKNSMQNENNFSQSEINRLLNRYFNEKIPEEDTKRTYDFQNGHRYSDQITLDSNQSPTTDINGFEQQIGTPRNTHLIEILSELTKVPTIELPTYKESGPDKNVELTYIVRQPQVFLYHPQVIVKHKLKYEQFLKNINNLLNSNTISSKGKVQLQKVVKLQNNKEVVLYETSNLKSPLEVIDAITLDEKLNGAKCDKRKSTEKERESREDRMFTFFPRRDNNLSDAKKLVELANSKTTETQITANNTQPSDNSLKILDENLNLSNISKPVTNEYLSFKQSFSESNQPELNQSYYESPDENENLKAVKDVNTGITNGQLQMVDHPVPNPVQYEDSENAVTSYVISDFNNVSHDYSGTQV